MSMSFTLTAPEAETRATGINGLQERLVKALREQEEYIIGDIEAAVDLSSPLMSLPEPVKEQFRRWAADAANLTPEQAFKEKWMLRFRLGLRKINNFKTTSPVFPAPAGLWRVCARWPFRLASPMRLRSRCRQRIADAAPVPAALHGPA